MGEIKFWLKKSLNPWFFLLLLTLILPVVLPLLQKGMFVSDDGEWMIIRFSAFHQALRDGQFPVRWLGRLNHEYGYPVANFLYPGFMYLAEVPKVLGFGFVDSIKIILGLSLLSSGVFTYLWLKKIFSDWPALLGALFYLYAPYHLWDVYKRGSVGEILALAVVPFVFWMMERGKWVLSSLGIGLLILSHNTLAVLFFPIIVIYALLRKSFTTYSLLLTIIFGLGLSAVFWIPAIFDLRYTQFFQTKISDYKDFFANPSLLGWPIIIIFFLSVFSLISHNHTDNQRRISSFFLVIGLVTAFLSLSQSSLFWQLIPTNFIQFPFRLLSIVILSGAYLLSWILCQVSGKKRWLAIIVFGGIIIISVQPYIKPIGFTNKGDGFYSTNEDTTTVKNEYMPIWVKNIPQERAKNKVEVLTGSGEINLLSSANGKIVFQTLSITPIQVRTNTIYFPGWQAEIDGKKTPILFDNPEGLMVISAPPGTHEVKLLWKETPVRKVSDLVSILTLVGLIIGFILKRKFSYV